MTLVPIFIYIYIDIFFLLTSKITLLNLFDSTNEKVGVKINQGGGASRNLRRRQILERGG